MLYVRGVRLCLACVLLYTIIIYMCNCVYIYIYHSTYLFFDESFINSSIHISFTKDTTLQPFFSFNR